MFKFTSDEKLLKGLWDSSIEDEIDCDQDTMSLVDRFKETFKKSNKTTLFLSNHDYEINGVFYGQSSKTVYTVGYKVDLLSFYGMFDNVNDRAGTAVRYFEVDWGSPSSSIESDTKNYIRGLSRYLFSIEMEAEKEKYLSKHELSTLDNCNLNSLLFFINHYEPDPNLIQTIVDRIVGYMNNPKNIEDRKNIILDDYKNKLMNLFISYKSLLSEDDLIRLTDQTIKIETIQSE